MAMLTELILVPGHAVWSLKGNPLDEWTWHLKPYQNSEVRYFVEHIRAGVELAAARSEALLVFSGAATERAAGPVSEALGYWRIADHFEWWGHSSVRERTVLEEYSLDSFLNVLYGLHRFRQVAGDWPERVTVCGWGFKSRRIGGLHREALKWTRPFDCIAVNDPVNLNEVREREVRTCAEFEADPRGDHAPIATKRAARKPLGYVAPAGWEDLGWL